MSLADQVRQNISEECLARRCRRDGCSLTLESLAQPFLLIDMDHEKSPTNDSGGKKCDFIFIGDESNSSWIATLELKRGKLRAKEMLAQLQAGAKVAERIVPHNDRARFRPIAVYGGKAHLAERKRLSSNRVRFRSQKNRVALVRCGTSLVGALKKRT